MIARQHNLVDEISRKFLFGKLHNTAKEEEEEKR